MTFVAVISISGIDFGGGRLTQMGWPNSINDQLFGAEVAKNLEKWHYFGKNLPLIDIIATPIDPPPKKICHQKHRKNANKQVLVFR